MRAHWKFQEKCHSKYHCGGRFPGGAWANELGSRIQVPLDGQQIEVPERFVPDPVLIARHREEVFVDSCSGQK